MSFSVAQKNFGKTTEAAFLILIHLGKRRVEQLWLSAFGKGIFTDHGNLEPEPIFSSSRDMRNTPSGRFQLAHKFIKGQFEWICSSRVEHMCIIHRLEMITIRF